MHPEPNKNMLYITDSKNILDASGGKSFGVKNGALIALLGLQCL